MVLKRCLVLVSKKMKIKKEYLIYIAALVTPGGFVALGLWKAYDIYKKKQAERLAKPKTLDEFVAKMKSEIEENPE